MCHEAGQSASFQGGREGGSSQAQYDDDVERSIYNYLNVIIIGTMWYITNTIRTRYFNLEKSSTDLNDQKSI